MGARIDAVSTRGARRAVAASTALAAVTDRTGVATGATLAARRTRNGGRVTVAAIAAISTAVGCRS